MQITRNAAAIIVTFFAGFLVLSGCSTPPPQPESLVGLSLENARQKLDESGTSLVLAQDCELDVFDGSLENTTPWRPSNISEELAKAVVVTDARTSGSGVITFCGRLNIKSLPPVTSDSIGLQKAQLVCVEESKALNTAVGTLTPADLFFGSVSKTFPEDNPAFLPVSDFEYLSWNLQNFILGLDWLEWVTPSSLAAQRVEYWSIGQIQSLIVENGNPQVRKSILSAVSLFNEAQVRARNFCRSIMVLTPPAVKGSEVDASTINQTQVGEVVASGSIPEGTSRLRGMAIGEDGDLLVVADAAYMFVFSTPDLSRVATVPLRGDDGNVTTLTISPDSKYAYAALSHDFDGKSDLVQVDLSTFKVSGRKVIKGSVDQIYAGPDEVLVLAVRSAQEAAGRADMDAVVVLDSLRGRVETLIQINYQDWEYDDNSFSQIVQEPSGSSVLMATPEGVLLKIDYERKKVTRPFKGELYNRGNSVVASPGGERFYILTSDDNRLVPGAFVILSPNRMKFEKDSLAGSTASDGALLTATSTPGLVIVSPYVYGDEPSERELRFVQIPSSPLIITESEALVASIKIFMAEGAYPFAVADPTEPLVYVISGTNTAIVARKIPN